MSDLTSDAKSASGNRARTSHGGTTHQYLRAWRKAHGLTLKQLSEKISVNLTTIAGWEVGERKISLPDLETLAAFYRVHPAALMYAPEADPAVRDRYFQAARLVEGMSETDAAEWLRLGERFRSRHDAAAHQ